MNSIGLFFALLWRTVVVYFLLALPAIQLISLLRGAGVDLLPAESVAFIKLKPTLVFASFSLALLATELGSHFNLVRLIVGAKLNLSSGSWRYYIIGLSILMFALAGLNMLVAATTSVGTWVTYKVFGASGLLVIGIFVLANRVSRFPKQA